VSYLDDGMFTGLVEELGVLASSDGARLVFEAATVIADSQVGDSIAVNGCCLTVVELGPGWWAADVVAETRRRTNLGELQPGDPVNLERPVQVGSRLGGHLVQGHVDAVGTILSPPPDLEVALDAWLAPYVVEKGSITVDGISLTVVAVTPRSFRVAIIPHTLEVTTLGRKSAGDRVNLEVDVIAKYAERLLQAGTASPYTALGATGEDREDLDSIREG
jgi:riboflavin synthase